LLFRTGAIEIGIRKNADVGGAAARHHPERSERRMELIGEQRLAAPRARVWAALNDIDVLKACIPGCESLERGEDGGLTARVVAKVGPVKATFTGKVTFENVVEGVSYTITGEGQGGVAGFAKGSADVILGDDGTGGTVLGYTVHASVGGKLAQLGARLIDSTAKSMAEAFFTRFAAEVAPTEVPAPPSDGGEVTEADADGPAPGTLAEAAARGIVDPTDSVAPTQSGASAATATTGGVPPWALLLGGAAIVGLIYLIAAR
jgi:carbon monoxide dehydrogenase subunit G